MKQYVRCIKQIDHFTVGKVYEFTHIDEDGDMWVTADDDGHAMFFYPHECQFVTDKDCACICNCGAK